MANLKISQLTPGNPAQSGDVIPIERSDVNFSITAGSIAALAGGSVPAGSLLTTGIRGSSSNSGWSSYSMWCGIYGESILVPATKFKIRISAIGGTGISLNAAALVATDRGSTTVLASPAPVPITWNGGSASYATAFSGASATNPFYLDSDAITATIDTEHDWYVYIYLDDDGTGYNSGLNLWGTSPSFASMLFGHGSGNTIPVAGGTVGTIGESAVPLVVAIMAG